MAAAVFFWRPPTNKQLELLLNIVLEGAGP
jgi:hypothetical protein